MALPPGYTLEKSSSAVPPGYTLDSDKQNLPSSALQRGRNIVGVPGGSSLAGAVNALQGPTFGFFDEIFGAAKAANAVFGPHLPIGPITSAMIAVPKMMYSVLGAPFSHKTMGEHYTEGRDYVRGMTEQFRKDYPIISPVTSAMTAAPMMMLGAGSPSQLPVAAGLIPQMWRAAKVGGLQSTISGAGESTDPTKLGVVGDAVTGGIIGGAAGGLSQGVMNVGGKIINNIAPRIPAILKRIETPYNEAAVKLAEALQRSAPNLASPSGRAAARINRYGNEATIADVGGVAPKNLLDVLTTLPGSIRDEFNLLIRNRRIGTPKRIMADADNALGTSGAGYTKSLDDLAATQKAAQAPFREQLKGLSVRVDEELIAILNREPRAFMRAKNLSRKDPETHGLPVDLSKLKVGDDIPFNSLDTIKKALWTIAQKEKVDFKPTPESNATNSIRVALTEKMDKLSPKDDSGSIYKHAREAFAGPAEMRSAIEAGRTVMKKDAISIAELTKGMTAGEMEAFRIGALQSLRDSVGTKAGQTSLLEMYRYPATSDKLREIFGSNYRKFSANVAKETRLKELESVGSGSHTFQRAVAASDLDDKTMMEALQSARSGLSGNISEAINFGARAWNRIAMPEATRNELARMLMSRGTEAQRNLKNVDELIRLMNENAARRAAITGSASGQLTGQLDRQ